MNGPFPESRARLAELCFTPLGPICGVMFQIVCALVLDVPAAAECLMNFKGISPNVLLAFEPWGHVDHTGVECRCRSSDQTGAYVHVWRVAPPISAVVHVNVS